MKKSIYILFILTAAIRVSAQTDFKSQITQAKASYTTNKLEETHFALQQALSEIDITIGKEILKILPEKMDNALVNPKNDQVSSNAGIVGATVQRSYGTPDKVRFELMSNSPMVTTLNAFLNNPMMGGMARDENNKTIKVQGYKARLERQIGINENEFNYVVQLAFSNALITFSVYNSTENEVTKLVNILPLQQIGKLVQ